MSRRGHEDASLRHHALLIRVRVDNTAVLQRLSTQHRLAGLRDEAGNREQLQRDSALFWRLEHRLRWLGLLLGEAGTLIRHEIRSLPSLLYNLLAGARPHLDVLRAVRRLR